jgi:6-phosphofructokinase 1
MIKRIGVLTSGGDAPGMNAALRAVVLTATAAGVEVIGFNHGFNGVFQQDMRSLQPADVLHIGRFGGTILKSARCKELLTPQGPVLAAKHLQQCAIDALIVIGGDGSFRGCLAIALHFHGIIAGLPGTIDNDLDGTDYTIGFLTALQTSLDAIDKIRDTADAFERTFLIEVMGRHTGYLALAAGIAAGAEQIICPEYGEQIDIADIAADIRARQQAFGAGSYIIVMAETMFKAGAQALAEQLSQQSGTECRAVVLGHLQRGGSPIGSDRILATKLGAYLVEQVIAGHAHLMMAGEQAGQCTLYPLSLTGAKQKKADPYLLNWQNRLLQQH